MKRKLILTFLPVMLTVFFINIFYSAAIFAETNDVIAEKAMVATAHPIASAVGIEILKEGGNAVDAAMAVAFALSIAEPNASGIGGGGFIVIKMANQKEAVMIDYRERAPERAVAEYYYDSESGFKSLTTVGPSAIGVPGLVAGAEISLKKYGTMTLAQILQPAIELCKNGIVVSEKLNEMILNNIEKISNYPATAEVYLKDMFPLEEGDTLRNLDLASSLVKLSGQGGDIFYKGELAKLMANEIQQLGGVLSYSDLKTYEAKVRKPVRGKYRGYDIITSAPPSWGGTHLIELLNIMEGYNVKKMEHNSAKYIHVFTEAMKMIYADKAINAADPDFYKVPVKTFLKKRYAKKLRKRIEPNKARFDYKSKKRSSRESTSTSHLSIVDEHGNIVALTQSINHWFGSGVVVPGTGILLNDHMNDFNDKPGTPNSIEPFKRPASNTAPTIILKNGKPFMTLGTPGGSRIISALAQVIMNVIDFEMSMDDAIEAPRVHCINKVLHVEGRINEKVIDVLREMGHEVKVRSDFDNYFGGAQGILFNHQTNKLHGGADSRRDGKAIGY